LTVAIGHENLSIMFGNFIYFIIVLLIYSTYQPAEDPNLSLWHSLILFFALTLGFVGLNWLQFRRIERQLFGETTYRIEHKFTSLITAHSIFAIFLFAIVIYGLNLSYFTSQLSLFQIIPTLEALLFLAMFIGYLSIIWTTAHRLYTRLYRSGIDRRTYVTSNIMFSLPVLLPWLILSGVADLISALPFETPRHLLATTEGEITYFLIFLVLVAIVGPFIIQQFWRCKPLQPGMHRTLIENLCKKADLQYNNILMWPIFEGRMITAGVMGLVKKFRYILVTRALLRILDPMEIEAVIAHEIGHVKKRHLLFYLFFFVGYMLIAYALFDLIIYVAIYLNPFIDLLYKIGLDQTTVMPALFSLAIILAFLFYFRIIFGYFMRNFERQADTYVFDVLDSATPLISTLEKITRTSGQPADKPNWHHFSIQERIDFLKRCQIDRSWIARQHAKVRRGILLYLMGIAVAGGIGYQLNFGETGKRLDDHFFEKVLLQELAKTPQNANLFTMLGDLRYGRGRLPEAKEAYEQAIHLEDVNSRALNNLAWLYATAGDPSLRDPARALTLAKKAASLETAPHILDTLAESYYANGLFHEAVETEKKALDMVKTGGSYYEGQLRKFEDALIE